MQLKLTPVNETIAIPVHEELLEMSRRLRD